ncbi:hypothetical protein CYMTET_9420 [Cymbomonas tetramitiformis]|uniref:Uncharacterized protein n=1 Tax=Cymbomonas tetramitiformis TaxID=36881 RepID=A0AAE0LFH8_9CHLO|nr:hypothetical protein CYMTET_9420 [Cymbomonas tetramitiformis]
MKQRTKAHSFVLRYAPLLLIPPRGWLAGVVNSPRITMTGSDPQFIHITQKPGQDLFAEWQLPEEFSHGIADSWQCELVPTPNNDDELLEHVLQGVPVLASEDHAVRVFEAVGGNALDWLCQPEWDTLPAPKVCMIGGWGQPGSDVDGGDFVGTVHSFSQLLADPRKINLQMFHRAEGTNAEHPSQAPPAEASTERRKEIPCTPNLLRWPLEEKLHGRDQQRSVVVDNATRVSKEGALTWWHLDDGGEFVFQVGLPLAMPGPPSSRDSTTSRSAETIGEGEPLPQGVGPEDRGGAPMPAGGQAGAEACAEGVTPGRSGSGGHRSADGRAEGGKEAARPVLLGPNGRPIVKLFMFSDKGAYSFITQDRETNKSGHFCCLDLFNTPDHHLPSCQAGQTTSLTKFYIAPLEAGGRPLLSPPNVPHAVLTLQTCVMVEQRRILHLFLDEVSYFMSRAERWTTAPIMYNFIAEDLQDEDYVHDHVVLPLIQ